MLLNPQPPLLSLSLPYIPFLTFSSSRFLREKRRFTCFKFFPISTISKLNLCRNHILSNLNHPCDQKNPSLYSKMSSTLLFQRSKKAIEKDSKPRSPYIRVKQDEHSAWILFLTLDLESSFDKKSMPLSRLDLVNGLLHSIRYTLFLLFNLSRRV